MLKTEKLSPCRCFSKKITFGAREGVEGNCLCHDATEYSSAYQSYLPNLKFVALPIPEIIGGTPKIWGVPGFVHAPYSQGIKELACMHVK